MFIPISNKEFSVFESHPLKDIYQEIREVYLSDDRPWIIGYSGGKDSTCALQLIWYALKELPVEKRNKKVHVISSDTLVETPVIVNYITNTLDKINSEANKQHMPFRAEIVRPIIGETFWVNLIGRGYPAPQTTFRWCTDRLKIRPADRFIFEKVAAYGEVILVLGVRKSESTTRAQVMSLYKKKGSVLSRHSKFPQTWVYTPIEDFSTSDVWSYLLQNPSPFGNDNRDLAAMYKNAQAGECPLVVDTTTPSCGNSRFGCWVCTVVQRDRSMENMIDNGEEWMEPLLEIRNYLASTQDPSKKHLYREYKRRSGKVSFKSDGSGVITRGPYTLEFCKVLLGKILQAQTKIKKSNPDKSMNLILTEELHEIRRLWIMERGDWEDSLPKIYREAIGEDLDWTDEDIGLFCSKEQKILEKICAQHETPLRLVTKLLDVERHVQGMSRRSSVYEKIDSVMHEEWRTEEEILQNLNNGKDILKDDQCE